MHRSIREGLEDLLQAEPSATGHHELREHLSSCAECSREVTLMKDQAVVLRSLRAPEGTEPAGGFYARVMQRIEESAKESIWSILVDSPVGRRLAYISLTITVLLGSYVISQEARDGHLSGHVVIAQQQLTDNAPVVGSQEQQRDAVLVNFASTQESLQ